MNVEEFLEHEYLALRRFAAVVGHSGTSPDDLLHDALISVLRSDQFDTLDNPKAYVRRAIVHNASNDRRRLGRQRRLLSRIRNDADSVDIYPSDLAHLDKLSATARAVLVLHYVDGHPYGQVAVLLDMSPANVRKISQRARETLSDTVSDDMQGVKR